MPWHDPPPRRITLVEWDEQFRRVPDELIARYRYYSAEGKQYPWATYLFPPTTFAIYGSRHLRRLKFDNSLAALRMWGFAMSETERLFRARQIGKQVIATMGDLGGTPPMVLAAGNTVPFYPDCIWWVPFTNESTVLLDAAASMGIGESACYSRATLGAFMKRSYFPEPVLCIASTGASCDDYSAVEQLVESMGFPVQWFELPLRKERENWKLEIGNWKLEIDKSREPCLGCEKWHYTPAGTSYQESAREFLVSQFEGLRDRLELVLGRRLDDAALRSSIRKVNEVRRRVKRIKDMVYSAPAPIFPALEMMVLEFGNLHFYSDIDEWSAILAHLEETIAIRLKDHAFLGREDALRVVWVTPPADPLLLTYAEDQGLRVVGTEYVINQSLHEIDEEGEPIPALAEALLNASLIGSSRARAENAIRQAREFHAEGVIISGILGGSHCATETSLISEYIQAELDLPVLAFDVPPPTTGISSQIQTRMEAFIEVLRSRRQGKDQ